MQHAVTNRALVPRTTRGMLRGSTIQCRAATKTAVTPVKTPERFIPAWRELYSVLKSKGLRTVPPHRARALLTTGDWVLLDVRRPDQHDESHPSGALSVPMYRKIDVGQADLAKLFKVVAYSFNGVQPIEPNSNFTAEVLQAAPGKKIILVCEAGGTLQATVNFPLGKPSRSLQAAYKLFDEAGLTADDVVHLERGVYGWYQAELPLNGTYTPEIGRTPNAVNDPALWGLTHTYDTKEGDKPLQLPEKKDWFPW